MTFVRDMKRLAESFFRNGIQTTCLCAGLCLAGCTETPAPAVPATEPPQPVSARDTVPPAVEPKSSASTTGPWLNDPLEELRKEGVSPGQLDFPVARVAEELKATPDPSTEKTQAASPAEKLATTAPSDDMVPALESEVAQAAIKRSMLRLRKNLQNATVYGTEYEEVQACAEELAILFVLATRSESPPSWNQHVPSLRDLATEISLAARDLSPEAYKKAAHAFESIDQLLQGNIPDGIPAGRPLDLPFSEFVQRAPVMRRLELSEKLLQSSSATESEFKTQLDFLREEAAVSAVLMQSLAQPGFENADEPEYQAHVKALVEACRSAQTAASDKNYSQFQNAISALGKSCNDCHQDYRFNSE